MGARTPADAIWRHPARVVVVAFGLTTVGGAVLLTLPASAESALIEAITALLLTTRFASGYDVSVGRAVYLGIFHSISAFNNAGFGLHLCHRRHGRARGRRVDRGRAYGRGRAGGEPALISRWSGRRARTAAADRSAVVRLTG
jgi:hypothetical protein